MDVNTFIAITRLLSRLAAAILCGLLNGVIGGLFTEEWRDAGRSRTKIGGLSGEGECGKYGFFGRVMRNRINPLSGVRGVIYFGAITYLKNHIMPVELITLHDLQQFKKELLEELKKMLAAEPSYPKKVLKSRDVCKLLGISQGTLQNLRDSQAIPFGKLGRMLIYHPEDIDKAMKKKRGTS